MAGHLSSSSRDGTRRESFDSSQAGSLASNKQFIRLLTKLPDELVRLERENRELKMEVKESPSR